MCQWHTSCEPTEPAGETRRPSAETLGSKALRPDAAVFRKRGLMGTPGAPRFGRPVRISPQVGKSEISQLGGIVLPGFFGGAKHCLCRTQGERWKFGLSPFALRAAPKVKGRTLGRCPKPRQGPAGLACRLGRFAACVPLAHAHPLDRELGFPERLVFGLRDCLPRNVLIIPRPWAFEHPFFILSSAFA